MSLMTSVVVIILHRLWETLSFASIFSMPSYYCFLRLALLLSLVSRAITLGLPSGSSFVTTHLSLCLAIHSAFAWVHSHEAHAQAQVPDSVGYDAVRSLDT